MEDRAEDTTGQDSRKHNFILIINSLDDGMTQDTRHHHTKGTRKKEHDL